MLDGKMIIKVSPTSWKGAVGLASLVVYGPFLVMATYSLIFVACPHCKSTAWMLLPAAPGLIPWEATRLSLDLPGVLNALGFIPQFLGSLAMVWGLAALVRRGQRLRWVAVGVAIALVSIFAFITLSMILA